MRTYVANVSLFARWAERRRISLLCATPDEVLRYVAEQTEHYSRSTSKARLLALRSFYRYVLSRGWRPDEPTAGLPVRAIKRQPRRPYTWEELRALLGGCRTPRDEAMLLMLLGSGVRVSELTGMRGEDVDWVRGIILIRGKAERDRWVAPGERAMMALRAYTDTHGGSIWLTEDGCPVNRLRARKLIYGIAKRAGVPAVHPHGFRVTFANAFLEAGGDLGALQVIMGHSQITQTAYYAGFTAATRALDQQRRLNPADRL